MDKKLLFKARIPEADVEVEGLGTFRVRGLSRAEALEVQKADGVAEMERRMLSLALVDPALTEEEVGRWQAASVAGEMEPVGRKVQELSGMDDDFAKTAYKEFEASPDAEFRVPARDGAGDDGGAAGG